VYLSFLWCPGKMTCFFISLGSDMWASQSWMPTGSQGWWAC
jgi:hypothetical protein